MFQAEGRVGFGWVLRNYKTEFCTARNGSCAGPVDALLAEALSLLEVLSWLKRQSVFPVVIEFDALELVLALSFPSLNN